MRSTEQMCSNEAMANHTRLDELYLPIKASKLCYEQSNTHQVIADYLRISRLKVSHLLRQAGDKRIVNIIALSPQATPTPHVVFTIGGSGPRQAAVLRYKRPASCL